MAKRTKLPPGWTTPGVKDVCSVSGCVNDDFHDDYVGSWKHNGYFFFDSPDALRDAARALGAGLQDTTLFYYEGYPLEFDTDGDGWTPYAAHDFPTNVLVPGVKTLIGFDVVTFSVGFGPECSPLSCNSLADELAVNEHCLFTTIDEAHAQLETGAFTAAEPGPYRIYAVHEVAWSDAASAERAAEAGVRGS